MATISQSTRNFRKLYDLTKDLGLIEPSINYRSIVQKKSERWNILLEIWRKNKKIVGVNIFSAPLVNILYGFNYYNYWPTKEKNLLHEVERTLLDDNEAFNAWVHTDTFKRAYKCTIDRSGGCIEYINFLNASGTLRLLRGKTIAKLSRTKRSKPYYLLEREYFMKNQLYCDEFKNLFSKILPESVEWLDEQWMDYKNIFGCLNDTYDVNFRGYYSCLDAIYYLLKYSEYLPGYVDIYDIIKAPFNYNLVKAIFPNNTDDRILKLFENLSQRCNDYDRKNWLRDSWIVKILYQWTDDPEHKYYRKARKALIDLTMTK